MANPVGWFEIYVDDVPRAVKFYETVLQAKLQKLPGDLEMWAFPMEPHQEGASGALVHMPGLKAGGNSTIVYFNSEDCAVEAGRVAAAGGRIMKDKFSIGQYGFIALAYDTEGNILGLYSRR
jgi:predicted enzyme related to lactoylglutathione lyase